MNITQNNHINEKSNLCSNYNNQNYNSNNETICGANNSTVIINIDNKCSICLDGFARQDKIAKTECFHVFHFKCLEKMLSYRKVCALCNGNIHNYYYYNSKQDFLDSNYKLFSSNNKNEKISVFYIFCILFLLVIYGGLVCLFMRAIGMI